METGKEEDLELTFSCNCLNKFTINLMVKMSTKEKKYLISSYLVKKSGPRKDEKFYKEISLFWKTNRECCIEIINTLPRIGYYKDFFYILEHCNDKDLEEYLYQKIHKLIQKWKYGRNIILSKWIPREKSSFDRKYNFVGKISERLFPNDEKNIQKKKYRLLVSETCKKINTFESNLCAKTYDKIKDVTDNNLKTYQKVIMRNPELKKRVSEILKSRYEKFSLKRLLKEREKKILKDLRGTLLNPYIENKTKDFHIPASSLIVLNLDGNVFNNHLGYVIETLKSYFKNHDEFVINGVLPKLIRVKKDENIESLLNENIDEYSKLEMDKIKSIIDSKYKDFIIFSTHELSVDNYKEESIKWNLCKEKVFKERDVYRLEEILIKYNKKSWFEKALEWWNSLFKQE